MSNILSWTAISHKVKDLLDPASGIEKHSHAFAILMVATILQISEEEAADAITDGGKDRGVDAAVVMAENQIHLFQFKYAMSFEGAKKNFPSSEIDKIKSFFVDLLNLDKKMKDTCNAILWGKVQEIWLALKKPNAKIHIHFCGNLDSMEASEQKRANESFEDAYCTMHHYSLTKIAKLFSSRLRANIDRDIEVVDKDYFERTDGNIRGMICTVEAKQIVEMVRDPMNPSEVLGDIFDDNVRIYLTNANKINKKIISSALSDANALFWYLNNGITITCDSFAYMKNKRSPTVSLQNLQIVNGGQTTHALFEASKVNQEALSDVLIMVRIIETKSREISAAIAESTNSQTPIKGRDLRANDEVQKNLEIVFEGLGYKYERKTNQWADEPRAVRVDAQEAGQAKLAYILSYPEVAKKDRGRVFGDLYDTIYSEDVSAEELLIAFRLMKHIDKIKKEVQSAIRAGKNEAPRLFLIDGGAHVLYATYLMCIKGGIDPLDFDKAVMQVPAALNLVKKLVAKEQKKDSAFSFNRFFKDAKTKEKIHAAI